MHTKRSKNIKSLLLASALSLAIIASVPAQAASLLNVDFGAGPRCTVKWTRMFTATMPPASCSARTAREPATLTRLLSTRLLNSQHSTLNTHVYGYNLINQRTALTNTAGDYRNSTYSNLGQLKTAGGYPGASSGSSNQLAP